MVQYVATQQSVVAFPFEHSSVLGNAGVFNKASEQIHGRPIYSVRIGLHWRAVGTREGDVMIWYWIGSHAEYDRIVSA